MDAQNANGVVSLQTSHSVDEVVEKFQAILSQRNISLFAVVDHSAGATKAGLTMPPTKLLIFGNPKAGTPVMLAAPTSALDLPLKLLVWEDSNGKTWLSFNDPKYLQDRHQIPAELVANIGATAALVEQALR